MTTIYSKIDSFIKKVTPSWVYSFLIGQWDKEGLKKYFKNTNWIFISHAVNLLSSLLIFSAIARYLGPENLGRLNYAQSFVAIFSIFAGLGIDQILKRDLITYPEKEKSLIGTAMLSKFIFGFIIFIILTATAFVVETDQTIIMMIAISGFVFLLNPIGVLGNLFDSKVASKYNSYGRIIIAIVLPLTKVLIILFGKGIIFFSLTLVLEAVLGGFLILYFYKKVYSGSLSKLTFDFSILKQLLVDSWPLLLAGLSATIYSRIDQIMLQHLLNSSAVGLYSGAIKITSIVQIFPGIIIGSLFPAIVNAKKHDHKQYTSRLRSLVLFSSGLVLLMIIPIFVFAPLVVKIILGPEYLSSILILRIHVWAALGIALLAIAQNYLVAENKGKIFFVITSAGAIINIILNIILIKSHGASGAAVATLISYSATIVILLSFKKPREDIKMMIKKNENIL